MELSRREDVNRRMLRARDEMDRRYAEPLDIPTSAARSTTRPGPAQVRELVTKGALGGVFLLSDDVHAT